MQKSANKSPSAETRREAHQLLADAGSPELADEAIRSSASNSAKPSLQNDTFAQQHGFVSYLSMFEASKPAGKADGKSWLVTNVDAKKWILWNDQDLQAVHCFDSFEKAIEHSNGAVGAKSKPTQHQPPTG